jgi:hypothetical protein
MKHTKESRSEAIAELKRTVHEGDTLYTVLRHVSRSGMMRHIDVLQIVNDPQYGIQVYWLSRLAAKALGWGMDTREEHVRVNGCGMDMGFHVVHSLSYALFGDGYKLAQKWL